MREEDKLIILIIQQIVNGDKSNEIEHRIASSNIDWNRFKDLVNYHELAPFAYMIFRKFDGRVPEHINLLLKNTYYFSLISSQNKWQEFIRVYDFFWKEGINFIPIKGVSFLEDIYSEYPCRDMCDIDVLVKKEDLGIVKKILHKLGYNEYFAGLREEYWLETKCQIPFRKPRGSASPFIVEAHFSLDYKRNGMKILTQAWNRVREIKVKERVIKVLSAEDALLSIVLHERIFGNNFCLKYVLDAALLIKKYNSTFDWDYVLREVETSNLKSSLFYFLSSLKLIQEGCLPIDVDKAIPIHVAKRKLIRDFISNNIFLDSIGSKSKTTYLKIHFLLNDSIREAISYIINIPYEHFTLYYNLTPYSKRTDFLYRNRLAYMPFRLLKEFAF